jgi:hypothetical protein
MRGAAAQRKSDMHVNKVDSGEAQIGAALKPLLGQGRLRWPRQQGEADNAATPLNKK